jgi:hypothetical protein
MAEVTHPFDGRTIERAIAEDLSLKGFTPKLHLPMLAAIAWDQVFPTSIAWSAGRPHPGSLLSLRCCTDGQKHRPRNLDVNPCEDQRACTNVICADYKRKRNMVLPNMCDDKQGFAKYVWKKLPEIRDDKRHLTLNTAEILPNLYDNHHCHVGFHKYLAYCH